MAYTRHCNGAPKLSKLDMSVNVYTRQFPAMIFVSAQSRSWGQQMNMMQPDCRASLAILHPLPARAAEVWWFDLLSHLHAVLAVQLVQYENDIDVLHARLIDNTPRSLASASSKTGMPCLPCPVFHRAWECGCQFMLSPQRRRRKGGRRWQKKKEEQEEEQIIFWESGRWVSTYCDLVLFDSRHSKNSKINS